MKIIGGFVYILTNTHHTVLYTGVTKDLKERVLQHKDKLHPRSFTAKYNCNKLVFYEGFSYLNDAIAYEKLIKGGSRKKKVELIEGMNPEWRDLYEEV